MARRAPFTPAERGLVAAAAALVFTRVLAFSLTTLGFTEHARSLVPPDAGLAQATVDLLAGVALGAYAVTMAVAQLASGWLSDRVGRRPVLLGGSAVFVAGAILCAGASDIWVLLAGRLLAGLGGVSSVAMAAVGETVPEERRTTAMALVGIPAGIAVFLGFLLGPVLAPAIGFAGLFLATAVLGVLSALPFLRGLPASLPGLATPGRSLGLPVLALAAAGFASNFAMSAVMYDFQSAVMPGLGNAGLAVTLGAAFLAVGATSRRLAAPGAARLGVVACLLALAAAAPLLRLGAGLGAGAGADASGAGPAAWLPAAAVAILSGCLFFAAHAVLAAVLPSQVSRLAGRSGGLGHGIQLVVAYLGSAAGAVAAGVTAPGLAGAFAALGAACLVAAAATLVGLRARSATPAAAA